MYFESWNCVLEKFSMSTKIEKNSLLSAFFLLSFLLGDCQLLHFLITVCIVYVLFAGADLWARDPQHTLCLSGRRGSHTLRLHHQGPLQQKSLLPRLLRADHGKSRRTDLGPLLFSLLLQKKALCTIGSASYVEQYNSFLHIKKTPQPLK